MWLYGSIYTRMAHHAKVKRVNNVEFSMSKPVEEKCEFFLLHLHELFDDQMNFVHILEL